MTEAHIPPAVTSDDRDDIRPTPEAERRMRELLASLPPPPTPEELARQQGVPWPPPTWDEMMAHLATFDWGDAWDGFDEWLDDSRHGRDMSKWILPEREDGE